MSKSDLMKWAHRWAREHRGEYEKYSDALSVGMKKAHAHKGEMEKEIPNTAMREGERDPLENGSAEKDPQMEKNVPERIRPNIPSGKAFSFAALARRGVPFLCLDWKKEGYEYRKDFRELYSPPRDRSTRSAREGERISL